MRTTILRRIVVGLLAAATVSITYGLLVRPRASRPTIAEQSVAEPAPPTGPTATTRLAAPKSAERADAKPDPRVNLEPYSFGPPFQIDDGLTFGPEKATRTRLAGLTGPGRDAVCRDKDDRLWACGLQARAALNNLIAKRQVRCTPTAPAESVVPARCVADDVDLGRRLVELGYARSEVDYLPEMDRARATSAGMWNGGWRLR